MTAVAVLAALRAGVRYVASAGLVRRILLRSALFALPASALWALLPVTAKRLALSSSGYGLLLGAVGLGAVLGLFLAAAGTGYLLTRQPERRPADNAPRRTAAADASRSQSAAASSSRAAAQSAAVRGTHVTVYNATRTQGLAASYAQRLTGAGYTSVDAKNWSGYGIQSSTVLYNGSANKAAAEAVGKELGFPVMQTPNLQVNGVAVVVTG